MFNRISFSHHRTTADYSLAVDVAAAAAAAAAAVQFSSSGWKPKQSSFG